MKLIILFISNLFIHVESLSIVKLFNLTKTDCFVEHDELVDECYICFYSKLNSKKFCFIFCFFVSNSNVK